MYNVFKENRVRRTGDAKRQESNKLRQVFHFKKVYGRMTMFQ